MIEQKLLEMGTKESELIAFAQLPRYPGKESELRRIAEARDWNNIPAGFLRNFAEALADYGINWVEEYGPERTRETRSRLSESGYRLYVAEGMAAKMLKTLTSNPTAYQNSVRLNQLLKDALNLNGAQK